MPSITTVMEPLAEASAWLQRLVRELQILAGRQGLPLELLITDRALTYLIPKQRIVAEECVARTLLIESMLRNQLAGDPSDATVAALSALNAMRPKNDQAAPDESMREKPEQGKPLGRQSATRPASVHPHPAIGKAIDIIRREYADPALGLGSVAPRVGLSPGRLCRRFREETGTGLTQCLLTVRMERAVELLRDSCLSIKQISTSVGYEHAANFTRAFRTTFGVSPRDARSTRSTSGGHPALDTRSRHSGISMSNL